MSWLGNFLIADDDQHGYPFRARLLREALHGGVSAPPGVAPRWLRCGARRRDPAATRAAGRVVGWDRRAWRGGGTQTPSKSAQHETSTTSTGTTTAPSVVSAANTRAAPCPTNRGFCS